MKTRCRTEAGAEPLDLLRSEINDLIQFAVRTGLLPLLAVTRVVSANRELALAPVKHWIFLVVAVRIISVGIIQNNGIAVVQME